MHLEKASSSCSSCACCAGVGGPPLGESAWQAFCAAWNVGEVGSIPPPRWIAPLLLGSGKLVTPCSRMQVEYATPCAGLATTVPPAVAVAATVVVPTLATC